MIQITRTTTVKITEKYIQQQPDIQCTSSFIFKSKTLELMENQYCASFFLKLQNISKIALKTQDVPNL